MSEEKLIKQQLIKNMLYNLIAFTIIFTIFGAIIYNQVRTSMYSNVNEQLLRFKNASTDDNFLTGPRVPSEDGQSSLMMERRTNITQETFVVTNGEEPDINIRYGRIIGNPEIVFIIRDESGTVINESRMRTFYDEYLLNTEFDSENIENIYDVKINDEYNYKGITYKGTDEYGQTIYIQLLINVDSQVHIMDNLFRIISIGVIVTVILSIIASYLLGIKALEPVMASWKKQTEFVQNASHELRTPLTIIQAKQELLLKEPNSTILDKSDEIDLTIDETRRLSKLTTELMTLARADSNEQELSKQKINIDELIQEVAKPYIEIAHAQNKGMKLNLNFNKEILIDQNRIHQLMVILLDNGIKYTELGDVIEISTYLKDNRCVIEVKDTGIGISDEGMDRVFDRFYREDKARSRENGGTGLGLAIAHWIVTAHGGTIKAIKNEPKGTVIVVKLK